MEVAVAVAKKSEHVRPGMAGMMPVSVLQVNTSDLPPLVVFYETTPDSKYSKQQFRPSDIIPIPECQESSPMIPR